MMSRYLLMLIAVLLLPLWSEAVGPKIIAGTCRQVNWDAVTTSDLAGYRIYLTRVQGSYDFTSPSASPAKTDMVALCPTEKAIAGGQWWLVMKSIDLTGNLSALASNEAPFEIVVPDTIGPPAPTNVVIKAVP